MRLLLTLVLVAAMFGTARAEFGYGDTVDWATVDSDLVVIGKITSVTSRKGGGSVTWYRATVAVTETLKGKPVKSTSFVMRHMVNDSPATWKTRDDEVVLFLIDSTREPILGPESRDNDYGLAQYKLRSKAANQGHHAVVIGTGHVFTSTFDLLTKRDDILAAIRAAADSPASGSMLIDVPSGTPAYQVLYNGSRTQIVAAIDPALEQVALGWLGAKDVMLRERAAIVLGRFRSDANIAHLTKLLVDPGAIRRSIGNGPLMKHYPVRKAAHEALAKWGVPHPAPEIDVEN